jgi:monothiol glutaredoxin
MLYEALAGRMGGILHAIALETSAPADGWKATATSSEGVRELMSQQTDHDRIRTLVTCNDVVLFMKGTKNSPQCGFSHQVDQILQQLGVDYKDINVLDDATVRDGIKSYTNWPTIPQLYVKGEFVGGCDIVREMFQSGDLQELLNQKGVHDDKHPTPA